MEQTPECGLQEFRTVNMLNGIANEFNYRSIPCTSGNLICWIVTDFNLNYWRRPPSRYFNLVKSRMCGKLFMAWQLFLDRSGGVLSN